MTDPSAPGPWAGLLPLTAAVAAAGSAVLLKWSNVDEALLPVVAWQLMIGGTVLLALSASLEPGRTVAWTWRFVGYLAFLSLGGTTFAVAAWYWLVQQGDVGRLSILLMVLVPVIGLTLAWMFFKEPIHTSSALGAALAIAGVEVVARSSDVSSSPPDTTRAPRPFRPSERE